MSENPIIIYATDWCSDCIRSRNFLLKHAVAFTWIDIDKDQEGARYVVEVNKGMRSIPTIVFEDGSILIEPTNAELGEKLGITDA
jgi:glutaredoxin-like protein